MKYIFTALILFLIYPSVTQAQSNYKPGYLINLQKDTVKGYVDYHEWWNNPKTFNFKKTLASPAENITVGNCREVGVDGQERFLMFNTSISKGKVDLPDLPNQLDSSYTVENLFLKMVYAGKNYALLSYKDNLKIRYYLLSKKEQELNELNYYTFIESPGKIKTVKSYQAQLLGVASANNLNDDKLTSQIINSSYNESSLFKIFRVLNNDDSKVKAYKSPVGVRFFAGGGGRSAKLTFRTYAAVVPGASIKNGGAFFSAGADLLFNKNTRRIFLRGEFTYFNNHFVSDNVPSGFNSGQYYNSLDVKQTTFGFLPQLIYNFYETDDVKFFAGLGVGINWSTYKQDTTNPNAFNPIRFDKTWYSLPIKLGVLFNNHFEGHVGYNTLGTVEGLGAITHTSFEGGVNFLF